MIAPTIPDCPVCLEPLAPARARFVCPDCQTPHHLDCWQYNGRCGIFACAAGTIQPCEDDEKPDRASPAAPDRPPADELPAGSDSRISRVSIAIILAVLVVVASLGTTSFDRARRRANTRACYSNQKSIAGALEMYNLDRNTKVTVLGSDMLTVLKSGGYGSVYQDPGEHSGRWPPYSTNNYQYVPTGNGVTCRVHGSIR